MDQEKRGEIIANSLDERKAGYPPIPPTYPCPPCVDLYNIWIGTNILWSISMLTRSIVISVNIINVYTDGKI